jgi:hypothetical protein
VRASAHAGRAAELSVFELRFDGSAQQVNATLQGGAAACVLACLLAECVLLCVW